MSGCRPRRNIVPAAAYLPHARPQNPSPVRQVGQQAVTALQDITTEILRTFSTVLPSNYVSQVSGPNYILQYQALAEQIAKIQLSMEETGLQSDVDFTRPEYLWQMVGSMVLPDTRLSPRGPFEIDGDLTYRDFLKRMIALLLQGSTEATQKAGLELLTDGVIRVLAKVDFSKEPTSGWGITDQFTFEVDVLCAQTWGDGTRGDLGTGFPSDPFVTLRNNQRILRVLKPAAALYEYRHLFIDIAQTFSDTWRSMLTSWYYEDFRKFCCGRKRIASTAGVTLAGRMLFQDTTLTFDNILPGATLEISSGPNTKPTSGGKDAFGLGRYRVGQAKRLLSGADSIARAYLTSPTGLSGMATTTDTGDVEDPDQDFSLAVEGELLTFSGGPNAGTYRLETILGNGGGPVGFVEPGIGATSVRVALCLIAVDRRMPEMAVGQTYTLSVERLGVRIPFHVTGENMAPQVYP